MKNKFLPICAVALLSVGYSSVASASTGTMTKEEVAQVQQDMVKKEAAKQATKGEKLPNTASDNVTMMALSACLIALGSVFGFTRRKIKA
ncbi:LPXTG cell wall anchor domain-containing protein [Bacillus cereus]|nr:LPXTG cell wall anchor domain-containing protein [Bacillus cereus]MEB9571377.1 LPXTG cell wall anchor domain-containing protein [Bacillus cereus]